MEGVSSFCSWVFHALGIVCKAWTIYWDFHVEVSFTNLIVMFCFHLLDSLCMESHWWMIMNMKNKIVYHSWNRCKSLCSFGSDLFDLDIAESAHIWETCQNLQLVHTQELFSWCVKLHGHSFVKKNRSKFGVTIEFKLIKGISCLYVRHNYRQYGENCGFMETRHEKLIKPDVASIFQNLSRFFLHTYT